MTRLIQVMAGAPQGGAELYFVRLAAALQRAGLDQRIVMRPHSALLQPLEDAGVDVTPAPFGGPFDLKTPRILRREIEAFKPDLVVDPNRLPGRLQPRVLPFAGPRQGRVRLGRRILGCPCIAGPQVMIVVVRGSR